MTDWWRNRLLAPSLRGPVPEGRGGEGRADGGSHREGAVGASELGSRGEYDRVWARGSREKRLATRVLLTLGERLGAIACRVSDSIRGLRLPLASVTVTWIVMSRRTGKGKEVDWYCCWCESCMGRSGDDGGEFDGERRPSCPIDCLLAQPERLQSQGG